MGALGVLSQTCVTGFGELGVFGEARGFGRGGTHVPGNDQCVAEIG